MLRSRILTNRQTAANEPRTSMSKQDGYLKVRYLSESAIFSAIAPFL
ncbi:hypothetical protein BV96_02927 [Sphingomonas paucimobilis]|nr:hypothetical protein BV96_02927 [Sphingomonas paucimobilis]